MRSGLEILNLLDGQFVVAADDHLRPQLTHVLHQVVGERVVVVENEDHVRHFQCRQAVQPYSRIPRWLRDRELVDRLA